MIRTAAAALALSALSAGVLAAQARADGLAIGSVAFDGNHVLDDYTLATAISTSASSWTWRLFRAGERRVFDELEFRRDVVRLQLLYRQHGYYEARLDTTVRRGASSVGVTFRIDEGAPVLVDSVALEGADSVPGGAALTGAVLLQRGRPFDRFLFDASADSIALFVRNRGYPGATVFRNYAVDRRARTASVRYVVQPGTRARVGDIVIEGNQTVAAPTIRRSLTFHEGDPFSLSALFDSQRSLYQSGLFRYASVAVVQDSAADETDSLVRVRVRLAEAPAVQTRAGIGYGTIDCFRTQGTMSFLNFLGEARRLDFVARLSKIGVGAPLDFGLRNSLCPELAGDQFSDKLNYLGSVTFTQPSFLVPRSTVALTGFAERRSEINAYRFQSVGGALVLKFGFGRVVPFALSYRVSNDKTEAEPAIYCAYFNQCDQATLEPFRAARREASLTVSLVSTRTDSPLEPTTGRTLSLDLTTARPFLGSQIVFDRMVAEAVGYHRLARRTVLAARVRAGIVKPGLSQIDTLTLRYVPPSDRFYAGGPTSVRGFARNEMGPVVYVADSARVNADSTVTAFGERSSPIGSTAIALANLELRLPTPLWGGRIGVNAFVDAGELWDYDGTTYLPGGFRVTPGLGIQLSTPLGPMRLDAAYNDYGRSRGSLYVVNGTRLSLFASDYSGAQRGVTFLSHVQFHFSVGLAF